MKKAARCNVRPAQTIKKSYNENLSRIEVIVNAAIYTVRFYGSTDHWWSVLIQSIGERTIKLKRGNRMRVLLLEDHEYPVNQWVSMVGMFARHAGDCVVRYPAGTMVEVAPSRNIIVNGQETAHKLSNKPSAWTELLTRKEVDREQYELSLELTSALDSRQQMEDRARDAEYEVRECRELLEKNHYGLMELQACIIGMTTGITAEVIKRGMEAFARPKTEPQAIQENGEATRTDNSRGVC